MICMHHQTLFGSSNREEWNGQNMWYVDYKEKYIKGLSGQGLRKEIIGKTCVEMGGIYPKQVPGSAVAFPASLFKNPPPFGQPDLN